MRGYADVGGTRPVAAEIRLREQAAAAKTKHYGTRSSQVIPQPSTSLAQPRLTAEF